MRIDDRYAEALSRMGLRSFRSVMDCRMGTPVGFHDDRNVTRLRVDVDGGPRELYLKRTLYHPFRASLQELLSGRWPQTRPVREYEVSRQLDRLGIPAMKAVGWGEHRRWLLPHEGFLLVEAVPARLSLYNGWRHELDGSSKLSRSHKRQVLRETARLVRRLHDANLRWPDMVSKHLLFNLPSPEEKSPRWSLHLIDLERIHPGRTDREVRRDLIVLLKSMPPNTVARTDLLRFATAYCGGRDGGWSHCRRAIIERFGWAAPLLRRWRGKGGRGGREAPFVQGRYIRFRGVTLDDRYIEVFRQMGVGSFKDAFRWHPADASQSKSWRQCLPFEVQLQDGQTVRFVLKRYDRPPPGEQWRRIRRCRATHSLAWWQWHWARKLLEAGIPTSAPVAFGERMRGPLERRSFILLRGQEGMSLAEWLAGMPDGRLRRLVLEGCGTLLGRLHGAGAAFRDNPADHLMLTDAAVGSPRLCVADLESLRRSDRTRRAGRLGDLRALTAASCSSSLTRTDRMRFLRAYGRACEPAAEVRALIREIGLRA